MRNKIFKFLLVFYIIKNAFNMPGNMNVNGAGRVRVVAPPYPTCWINICPVPVPISVGYPLCGYPPIFLISVGIHEYLRVFTKIFKKTNI